MSHMAAYIDVVKLSKEPRAKCHESSCFIIFQNGGRIFPVLLRSSDAAGQRVSESSSPRKMTGLVELAALLAAWKTH